MPVGQHRVGQRPRVLVGRPELDLGLGESRGDGLDERADLFLNSACCSGSASTWRGRGLRRFPSRRTRYTQPTCTLTGRPSFWLIQSATVRASHSSSPSGAGPRTASASSATCSSESSGAARCEWVYCRLRIPSAPSAL